MKRTRKPAIVRRRAHRGGLLMLVGAIGVWLAGIGLVHVITINRIHSLGDQQRILEREISDLHREIDRANLQISSLSTEDRLSERLITMRSRLRGIRRDEIWKVAVKSGDEPAPPAQSSQPLTSLSQ